jgi:acid stress-induced BolA-like protein IbaG/YrbA
MHITEQVRTLIQKHLPDAQVLVEDPMNDSTHLRAVIVCPSFAGKTHIQRHFIILAVG